MSQTYILTVPRTVPKRTLKLMIQNNDVHKWTIGFEEGLNGYRHYQIRLVSSNNGFFEWVKAHIPTAHIEKASKEWNDYERKSGNFISSDDTTEIRQVRFGTLRPFQKQVLQTVKSQGVRQIDVFTTPAEWRGNHGSPITYMNTEKHITYLRYSEQGKQLYRMSRLKWNAKDGSLSVLTLLEPNRGLKTFTLPWKSSRMVL